MERIKKLQAAKFGNLNDFQTNRTQTLLEELFDEYGETLISAVEKQSIDLYGLYQWHTQRYVDFLGNLKEHFGQEILDKVTAIEMKKEEEQGRAFAAKSGQTFQSLVSHFTGGCDDRVIEENDEYVLVKTGECFAGRIAQKMGKAEMLYPHHCGLDMAFVKGFDPTLRLEIQKTIMDGDGYCLHKIWKQKRQQP